jgi:8-oxo-dGTP diphosphatase
VTARAGRSPSRTGKTAAEYRPLVAVLVVIFTVAEGDLKVLLIRRSLEPFEDWWAIPGGRLEPGETLDEGASRKLMEETGVADVYLEQLYTFDGLDRTGPQGAVAVAYFALVDYARARLAERSEWRPAWFSAAALPELAFDNRAVLDYALQRLRYKLDYTNVAYSLLPERFTMSRLQQTYESILGRKLDKRNFRKRMLSLGIVEATEERLAAGPHRPARLYSFSTRQPMIL